MSFILNDYLVEFEDGTTDYLTVEDLEEVFEYFKQYAAGEKILAVYKCVWKNEEE